MHDYCREIVLRNMTASREYAFPILIHNGILSFRLSQISTSAIKDDRKKTKNAGRGRNQEFGIGRERHWSNFACVKIEMARNALKIFIKREFALTNANELLQDGQLAAR